MAGSRAVLGARERGIGGAMTSQPCPKWSPTGRWDFSGTKCYALLTDWKQAQAGDRVIYGHDERTLLESTDDALKRMFKSWA